MERARHIDCYMTDIYIKWKRTFGQLPSWPYIPAIVNGYVRACVFIYGKRNAHTINMAIYQPKNQFKLRTCVVQRRQATIGSIKIIIDT